MTGNSGRHDHPRQRPHRVDSSDKHRRSRDGGQSDALQQHRHRHHSHGSHHYKSSKPHSTDRRSRKSEGSRSSRGSLQECTPDATPGSNQDLLAQPMYQDQTGLGSVYGATGQAYYDVTMADYNSNPLVALPVDHGGADKGQGKSRYPTSSSGSSIGPRRLTPGSSGKASPIDRGGHPASFGTQDHYGPSNYTAGDGHGHHRDAFTHPQSSHSLPAQPNFWDWDIVSQCWYHIDSDGTRVECPEELD